MTFDLIHVAALCGSKVNNFQSVEGEANLMVECETSLHHLLHSTFDCTSHNRRGRGSCYREKQSVESEMKGWEGRRDGGWEGGWEGEKEEGREGGERGEERREGGKREEE